MERKEADEKLIEKGVNFLPFIGEHYEEGIGFDDDLNLRLYGKKLLVLGDSHNINEAAGQKRTIAVKNHDSDNLGCARHGHEQARSQLSLARDFTRRFIEEDFLSPNKLHWWERDRALTLFHHALAGYKRDEPDKIQKLWSHIAFYTYVQEFGSDTRPNAKQYEKAGKPFLAVLHTLKPDFIIVWGMGLFNGLTEECGRFAGYFEVPYSDGSPSDDCTPGYIYTTGGHESHAVVIGYPDRNFGVKRWARVIRALMWGTAKTIYKSSGHIQRKIICR